MSESTSSTKQRPKRRRWLTFSIRGLMVLVLIAAIGMGWIASMRTQHQREKAIANQIEALDGTVQWNSRSVSSRMLDPFSPEPTQYEQWRAWLLGDDVDSRINRVIFEKACPAELFAELHNLEALTELMIVNGSVSDASCEAISNLASLTDISLVDTEISAKQLEKISSLPNVNHIYITHASVTKENVKLLAKFPNLTTLSICSSQIPAEGLACLRVAKNLSSLTLEADYNRSSSTAELSGLASLTQLEHLQIGEFPISDKDLEAIGAIRSLQALQITAEIALLNVTPKGLSHLASAGKLTRLDFPSAPFDDDTLRSLAKNRSLKEIHCDGSQITDAGLKHFEGHPSLTYLSIPGCQVTAEGIRSLAKNSSLTGLDLGDGVEFGVGGLRLVYGGGQTIVSSGDDSMDEDDDSTSDNNPFGKPDADTDPFDANPGGVF